MYSHSEMEYSVNSTTTSSPIVLPLSKTQTGEESDSQNTPIVIFLDRDKSLSPTFLLLNKRQKCYWGKENNFNLSEKIMRPYMVYEATEEQLEQSEITFTSWLPAKKNWQIEELELESQSNVIIPPHERTVLFRKKVTLKISDLPRWKSHIEINRHTLELIDE